MLEDIKNWAGASVDLQQKGGRARKTWQNYSEAKNISRKSYGRA
jgi:hypothetical protein